MACFVDISGFPCRNAKCLVAVCFSTAMMLGILVKAVCLLFTMFASQSDSIERMRSDGELSSSSSNLQLTDTPDNIFWFVQISDLHISKFHGLQRASDLERLCRDHLKYIHPSLVLLTGDLTDAKTFNGHGSMQFSEEWITYQKTMKSCMRSVETTWLDVRGNHDAFAIDRRSSKRNMYNEYGISSQKFRNGVAIQHVVKFDFGTYVFNGIDLAPSPGPGRPFNFFAVMAKGELLSIQNIADTSSNLTVWFGHYPLSVTTTPTELREMLRNGAAYLCGHLHTFLGFVPIMHARQPHGFLELELGDWKDGRIYRILAIDHDMLSFVDTRANEWPVVLITNPTPSQYILDNDINLQKMGNSTHIRFLVFTSATVIDSTVTIDDRTICDQVSHLRGPLFACRWFPSRYQSGFHILKVVVKDSDDRSAVSEITFSLDAKQQGLPWIGELFLLVDFVSVLQIMYYSIFFVVVLSPLMVHTCHQGSRTRAVLHIPVIGNMAAFISCRRLFVPLVVYSFYLWLGPNFIGELVPGSIGLSFTYGLYTNGRWIPGSLTYLYSSTHLLFFNIPIMTSVGAMTKRTNSRTPILHWLNLLTIIAFKLYSAYTLRISYGNLACITSFANIWSLPFMAWLVWQTRYLK